MYYIRKKLVNNILIIFFMMIDLMPMIYFKINLIIIYLWEINAMSNFVGHYISHRQLGIELWFASLRLPMMHRVVSII